MLGAEGHDDVQTLAAGRLDPAFEIEIVQPAPRAPRRLDDLRPAHAVARIDVEDDAVRRLHRVDARVPDVPFDHARGDEGDQRIARVDVAILPGLLQLLDRQSRYGFADEGLIARGMM